MELWARLVLEWPVIDAAPYTHWLLLMLGLIAVAGFVHLWNRREMNAIKAEKANAEATAKLAEKQRDGYKTEAENYKNELEKAHKISGPTQLAPVVYGNAAVQEAYRSVSSAVPAPITVTLNPNDYGKFAAFLRLEEAGLANVDQKKPLQKQIQSA